MKRDPKLKFAIGADSALVDLPLSMLMQTIFIGGYKGAGKTTAMKRLFEAAHEAGAQCGAIAPLGKWWSLRIAKNGRGPGLKGVVVFGGRFGDVEVRPGSGRTIARVVVSKRLHFVLDVELMRAADRAVFLADFFEELMLLKKNEPSPAPMVMLADEVQAIAPQTSSGKESQRLRELVAVFCRECRNFGAGFVMGAQRSASVDKEVLALCEMLLVMRTIHHLDRDVYKKWIDENGARDDEDAGAWLRRLRRLGKGEGYLYAPELNVFERVSVLMVKTYDATATATIGARVAKVGKLGKLDVKRLSAELSALVEQATADDPKALRAKIRELETKLAAKSVTAVVAGAVIGAVGAATKPAPKLDKRTLRRIERAAKDGRKVMHKLQETASGLVRQLDLAATAFREGAYALDVREKLPPQMGPPIGPPAPAKPPPSWKPGTVVQAVVKNDKIEKYVKAAAPTGDPDAKGPRAILAAVAQHNGGGTTREAITVITGYKRSTRDAYILRLVAAGYALVAENDRIVATDAGIAALGADYRPLPTGAALRDHWLRTLPVGERAVLGAVAGSYPKGLSREEITNATGYKVSTRNAYVLRLMARQLVNETDDVVRASETLFQEQR